MVHDTDKACDFDSTEEFRKMARKEAKRLGYKATGGWFNIRENGALQDRNNEIIGYEASAQFVTHRGSILYELHGFKVYF